MKTILKEAAFALGVALFAWVVRDSGAEALAIVPFGLFCAVTLSAPLWCPMAWLVWYGQPGPRSSDRAAEKRRMKP